MKHLFLSLILSLISITSIDSQQTVGLLLNDSLSQNGYTLWTSNRASYLIDNCGYLINSWTHNMKAGLSVYLLENGNLLRAESIGGFFSGAGEGGLIKEYDWEGNVVWSFQVANPEFKQHHDIEPLPNGNILLIAWELKTITQVEEAGGSKSTSYWPEIVIELEKVGSNDANIVWEWHAWDHLIQDYDSNRNNFGIVSEHPELIDINYIPPVGAGFGGADWLHFNGIDYDPVRDEIILSSRRMNEIYIIDHSTTTEEARGHSGGNRKKGGDILYRWGNANAYGMGETSDQKLYGQHDAKIIPSGFPGAGSITIFNNGLNRPGGQYSSIEEISPPIDPQGDYIRMPNQSFGPAGAEWQFKADPTNSFFSRNISGAHRLPNGNTFICSGVAAHFFEVNVLGDIVWDYISPIGINGPVTQGDTGPMSGRQNIFRATRYLPEFPGFSDKDMTPQELIELNPLPSDCIIYEEIVSGIHEHEKLKEVRIFHQFNQRSLELQNLSNAIHHFRLLNLNGQVLLFKKISQGNSIVDLSQYPKGMYIVYLTDENQSLIYTQKIVHH